MATAAVKPRKCQEGVITKKEKKNKLSKTPRNRDESWRVVPWELRAASAMLLSAWKSAVSDFSPFQLFSLSKCTWKLLRGIEQVGVCGEADRGWEWAGQLVKRLPLSLSKAQKCRTQRSKGSVAQSCSQASPRSLQRAEVEIGGVRLGTLDEG